MIYFFLSIFKTSNNTNCIIKYAMIALVAGVSKEMSFIQCVLQDFHAK